MSVPYRPGYRKLIDLNETETAKHRALELALDHAGIRFVRHYLERSREQRYLVLPESLKAALGVVVEMGKREERNGN